MGGEGKKERVVWVMVGGMCVDCLLAPACAGARIGGLRVGKFGGRDSVEWKSGWGSGAVSGCEIPRLRCATLGMTGWLRGDGEKGS